MSCWRNTYQVLTSSLLWQQLTHPDRGDAAGVVLPQYSLPRGGLKWGWMWVKASVYVMLPEECQALLFLELMSPSVDGEEDACVAPASH